VILWFFWGKRVCLMGGKGVSKPFLPSLMRREVAELRMPR
jgi:hypothetical protein